MKVVLCADWFFRGGGLDICLNVVTVVLGVNLPIAGVTAEHSNNWFGCRRSLFLLLHFVPERKFGCRLCYTCRRRRKEKLLSKEHILADILEMSISDPKLTDLLKTCVRLSLML